jgi:ribosomal protein S12 methylthiotransferase accessory factor
VNDSAYALLGDGRLADAVAEALAVSANGSVARLRRPDLAQLGAMVGALVVGADSWSTTAYDDVRRECAARQVPWLPVRAELGTVIIGPVERAGVPGCVRCLDLRERYAQAAPSDHDELWRRHGAGLAQRSSSWLTGLACLTVGALVAAELSLLTSSPELARTNCACLAVDLGTLAVTRHSFLPDPLCPKCGDAPADSPAAAAITLAARPKPAADVHRLRSLDGELDQLTKTYVDTKAGLLRNVGRADQGGLVMSAVEVRLRPDHVLEAGYGRTRSYRSADLTALLEALERYGGVEPGGKRTAVRASHRAIADHALDPRTCGVHPPESYARPGFPFQPFDEDLACDWVWGYSFGRGEPILVPERAAYYRIPREREQDRPFFYETSNGCALGNSIEEAILYGILEVAERDAFLLTWYGQLPVPRIDLDSAVDRVIPMQAAAIRASTGYDVLAFDITAEQGIPSVWAMAINPDNTAPKAVSAGGSHLSPERAVLNALSELGPILSTELRRSPATSEQGRQMVADPFLVAKMDDHSILHAAPEAFGRLGFLLEAPRVRGFAAADAAFHGSDLRDDLLAVMRRYRDCGLDVIVVDQTTSEHRAGGFSCVKVLIPGTIPMTFGYSHRRTCGLPRLYSVPHRLGYRPRPLQPGELNPHPHPFP